MTLTRVQGASNSASVNNTASFASGPIEGNLLIAVAMDRSGATSASMISSGWTLRSDQFILPADSTYRRSLIVWSKLAGASEPTDVTVTVDEKYCYLVIEEYSISAGGFVFEEMTEGNNGATTNAKIITSPNTSSLASGDYALIGVYGHKDSAGTPVPTQEWSNEDLIQGFWNIDADPGRGIATGYLLQESTSGVKTTTSTVGDEDFENTGLAIVFLVFEITTGITYTLDAVNGSFILSGQVASLLVGREVSGDAGSFTLSGQIANLLTTRELYGDAGVFILSGQGADLLGGRLLPAGVGALILTGQSAELRATRFLSGDAGAFSLSGQDSSLLRGLLLPGGAGSFILSGQDATLTYTSVGAYVLTASAGTFILSGQDSNLLRGLLLPAEAGAFTFSGQVTDLLRGLRLNAAPGSFVLTGQDAMLGRHIMVICDPGVFVLTGQVGNSLRGYLLEVEPGVFVLTGLPAILSYSGELIHREVITVFGEFTQLVSLSGEITQVVEVEGELTQLVEVSGELLED